MITANLITTYSIIFLVLLASLYLYIFLAKKTGIIDNPIGRSSHTTPTVNSGGIIFPVATVIWFSVYGWGQPYAIVGLLIISIISFIDDLKSLHPLIRLSVHSVAIGLLIYNTGVYGFHWYLILAAFVLIVGWINAFNFMDGINGITALYSLVSLATFSLLNNASVLLAPFFPHEVFEGWESFFSGGLVGTLVLAVLVFSIFNVRKKALTFAGGVGSISMAFLQSWMMINLMVVTREAAWILFFAVYGIDSVITILIRMRRGENILQPHRLHRYQLLANENKIPHLWVSFSYASIQAFVNLLTIWLMLNDLMSLPVFIAILGTLLLFYSLVRIKIKGRA